MGYKRFEVGLNNQKIALFGMVLAARETRRPVVLPDLCNFNPSSGAHAGVPFDQVYPVEGLYRFARAFGIEIRASPPIETVPAWDCFVKGSTRIAIEGARALAAVDDVAGHFFRNLRPHLASGMAFNKLRAAVFRLAAIRVVVQLRVEKDWNRYATGTLATMLPETEDYNPSFLEIIGKVRTELGPECDTVFIVCDEADLPTSKAAIRDAVMARYGVRLVWKSDVLATEELDTLSTLERSILDFELSIQAPVFVGLSRSTFSNMVSFESLCRHRVQPTRHYIYNVPGEHLGRRRDNGARLVPHEVTHPLYERRPLLPLSCEDIHWRASLVAHVSTFGDLWSEAGFIVGVYAGAMVCGVRGDPAGRFIEGFGLVSGLSTLTFEYRGKLDDGRWTGWMAPGNFVGTRGQNRPLHGFSVRLTGPLSLGFKCLCIGSFAGRPDLVVSGPGQDCVTDAPLKLEAMQILFRRA
jgi:hypothetical protein